MRSRPYWYASPSTTRRASIRPAWPGETNASSSGIVAANEAAARSATSVGTCCRAASDAGTRDWVTVPLVAASCI